MDKHLKIAHFFSRVFDDKFSLFGIKFGIDPLIGFIPIIGDIIPAVLSFYMIWIGKQLQLPNSKISQMIRNVLIDVVVGLFPVVGDAADFFVKANKKNYKILLDHLSKEVIDGEIVR